MTLVPDIAPEVFRQRLLIEGRFACDLDAEAVRRFLHDLAAELDLDTYGEPIVFAPQAMIANGRGREINAGYDAFVPLLDSGIAAYFWTVPKFFSIVIYSCAAFDQDRAVAFARAALAAEGEVVHAGF